jgi:hypothetical protein
MLIIYRPSRSGYKIGRQPLYRLALIAIVAVMVFASSLLAAQSKTSSGQSKNATGPVALSITDLQVKHTAAGRYLMRIQSDGPLAFDRLKSSNPRQILIRFYNVRTVDLPRLDPPPFGALSWSIGSRGEVTLIVDLASASTRVSVAQGGNPNLVELRLRD